MSGTAEQQGVRKVLIDQVGAVQAVGLAEDDGSGILYAEGKIGHCDIPTANGRIYTKKVMERELQKMRVRVENASAIGAVDHPGDGKSRIVGQAGTILRKIWMNEKGEVFGKFEIVEESSAGKDLAAFLRRGAQIGVSSRGMGSTRPSGDGNYVVGEDFKLTAYDFVADPAVSDAYPKVFTEDTDEQVTVEQLRGQFPELVNQIEDAAIMKAQLTCEAVFKEEANLAESAAVVAAKEEIRADITEAIRAEQYVQARADLHNEFATRLVEAVEALRPQVEAAVREEMASNPEEMTARQRLEHVAEILMPFAPTQDAQKVISEKDAVIDELRTALAGQEAADHEAIARAEKAEDYTRQLAKQLYVERAVGGRPDADELRARIGDINTYSADDLKEAVAEVVTEADEEIKRRAEWQREAEVRAEMRTKKLAEEKAAILSKVNEDRAATQENINALMEKFEAKFNALNSKLEEKDAALAESEKNQRLLEQRLQHQETDARRQRSIEYALSRTQGHPARGQIMEQVQSSNVILSAEQINDLAEQLTPRAEEPGGVAERVRAEMSRGRDHSGGFLGEDVAGASFDSIPELTKFGLNPADVRNFGGVRRR